MPTFHYEALEPGGAQVSGEIAAESGDAVLRQLRAAGQFPLQVNIVSGAPSEVRRGVRRRRGVKRQDLTIFSRQLASLVGGGLPLMRCVEALIEHTENETLLTVLENVRDDLRSGGTLWEAMDKHRRVFPTLYVSMIRAGEASGELPSILNWLAEHTEKEQARWTQVSFALAYPTLLLVVGTGAVAFLTVFMVPRFAAVYAELEQALPMSTAALMAVSQFLGRWWWVLGGALVSIGFAYRWYQSTPKGLWATDRLKLRLPLFGKLHQKMAMERLSRTLSILLRGGVPLLEALDVTGAVLGNEVLSRALGEVRQRVREGETIASHLRRSGRFPPLLIHLSAIGEETGTLPDALNTVADTYDVEVDAEIKGLIAMMEPAIILVMGVMVGLIITAMVMPIFQMNLMAGQ